MSLVLQMSPQAPLVAWHVSLNLPLPTRLGPGAHPTRRPHGGFFPPSSMGVILGFDGFMILVTPLTESSPW